MNFLELDPATRERMLDRFEAEQTSGLPYPPQNLSPRGLSEWPNLMRQAIRHSTGNEDSLAASLTRPELWNETESYTSGGVVRSRRINIGQAANRLALGEFNTWYVAGLAHRLLDEGQTECMVYRAADPKWTPAACSTHEGKTYSLREVIDGHRVGYWPSPGDASRLSIPAGPGCHHTICRVASPK